MNITFNTTLKDGTIIEMAIFPSSFFDTSKREDTLVVNASKSRLIFAPRGETWEEPLSEIVKYIPEDEISDYFKDIIIGMNSINDFFPMMKSGYIALKLKKQNFIKLINDTILKIKIETSTARASFNEILDSAQKLNLYNKEAVLMYEETVDYLEKKLNIDNTNLIINSDFKKIEDSFSIYKNDSKRKINLLRANFIEMVELHLENHIKFELYDMLNIFLKKIDKDLFFRPAEYGNLIKAKDLKFERLNREIETSFEESEKNLFHHFQITNEKETSSDITKNVNEKTVNFKKDMFKRYLDLKENDMILYTEFLKNLDNITTEANKEIDDSLDMYSIKNKFNNELEVLVKKYISKRKNLLAKIKNI